MGNGNNGTVRAKWGVMEGWSRRRNTKGSSSKG